MLQQQKRTGAWQAFWTGDDVTAPLSVSLPLSSRASTTSFERRTEAKSVYHFEAEVKPLCPLALGYSGSNDAQCVWGKKGCCLEPQASLGGRISEDV